VLFIVRHLPDKSAKKRAKTGIKNPQRFPIRRLLPHQGKAELLYGLTGRAAKKAGTVKI
jgi:hypothetical protein